MNLSKLAYLVLFFVGCWSGYYLIANTESQDMQVDPDIELPMFTGRNLYNTSYDSEGVRNYKIHSVTLEHFSKNGNTVFEKPRLIVYREGNIEEWIITSKTGVLDKEHNLTLNGDVLADNQLPEASFDTLATDSMTINLKNKDFSSAVPVVMSGPSFTNSGNAMKGNFDENVATLFNQVQGKYETLTP